MVDAGGENFVFWFSRTQESAFLDTISKNFVFVPQKSFVQQKSGEATAHPTPRLHVPYSPDIIFGNHITIPYPESNHTLFRRLHDAFFETIPFNKSKVPAS